MLAIGDGGMKARSFTGSQAGVITTAIHGNARIIEITPGRWPVEELWATYAQAPEGHLLIPHVGGRRAEVPTEHVDVGALVADRRLW